jgi:hypothetical protein
MASNQTKRMTFVKKILFKIAIVALSLYFSTTAFAAPKTGVNVPELTELDEIMTTWMATYGFNSATLAVSKNEKLVYEKGYGYQDENLTQPILPYARMRLATPSIALTKRALRQLVEDGLLNANDFVYQIVDLQPWQGSYADPRMQTMTIQHLIDDTSCIAADAPSVQLIGQWMGLGRNATLAESIQYQWSNSDSMRDPAEQPCAVGVNAYFSHYAMEVAAYIIAKTWNPDLNNTDYDSVGTAYGDYVKNQVGAPIGSVFLQWEIFESDKHENEVWYDSDGGYCDPQWNRYWNPSQPEVPCAYSIDSYARPGSGTIVSSGRDILNYLKHYSLATAETKPPGLAGWGSYQYALYGELPGTTSVIAEQVNGTTGESGAFVVLVNKVNSGAGDVIKNNINAFLAGVTQWPSIDLFGYVYSCTATTAAISDHVAGDRAYSRTDTSGCDPVVTYYATGSEQNLGTNASAVVTLKEDPPGYFSQGACSEVDSTPPQIILMGDNPLRIALGTAYAEPGYAAHDNVDGDITEEVAVTGGIDTQTEGTYYKYYDVADVAGNQAQTVIRAIMVEPAILQCVTAANSAHLSAGRAYRSGYRYYAVGSNNSLGYSSGTTTSLQETATNNWVRVDSCN